MDTASRQKLLQLLEAGALGITHDPILDSAPPPLPQDFEFDRIEGMMLGLAVGDSLGNTTESVAPSQRKAHYGEITDYLPNRHADDRRVGVASDDSQLAFWALEQMLRDGEMNPKRVCERFRGGQVYGIGRAVTEALHNFGRGCEWHECGSPSAGNGALMRIAPVLIPHIRRAGPDLWYDTIALSVITHKDPASTASCVAFVRMLWELLAIKSAPEPRWWLDTYVETAMRLEGETHYAPRGGEYLDYDGPVWMFAQRVVNEAYAQGKTAVGACNSWYSGAYLLETVPSVLYILMLYGHDPEQTLIRAVNDTRDNDTIAAIVGAAVGALHGKQAIPRRWLDGLTGRTASDDSGAMFRLLEAAQQRWWQLHVVAGTESGHSHL